MSTFDAIVPAGGTIDPDFAALVGTDQKALVSIGGRTMLDTTLRALRESGVIRNIVVVGSKEVQAKAAGYAAIGLDSGETGPDNIFRGFERLIAIDPNLERILIVTSDLPFLTAESVRNYLDLCPPDRDVCVAVIEAETFNRAYPGTSSTFVTTRDGVFTLGGMFLMNAQKMNLMRAAIDKVFARRKSKVGMARLIGPVFMFKWLTKSLTLADLESKIQSMLGCSGKAVRGGPVELAYDIDYRDDYEYALKHIEIKA